MTPNLVMLAGPNGAGKTTFYNSFLKDKGLPFVNADVIAEQLKIGAYEAASMAEEIRQNLYSRRQSFVAETVFSDPAGAKLEFLKTAVEAGYNVTLFFIGLENAELSGTRVNARVRAGGHDVPAEKIRDRFARTLANLKRAIEQLPRVIIYDNSSYEQPHRFVAEFRNGKMVRRCDGSIPDYLGLGD